ncbi:protein BIG GRAIN 1-like B [Hibiscus syriacus]|uniref:protein BIG GRAIN 1-like B n=1 Tax=Hibiscus syriacus TaxID=106335 RepID=UPI0019227EB1|nr:protein BIG GRAIN 1-like B [Hibiscus syriacus]
MKTSMRDSPSFSSTLLDKIYRSIDDGETKNEDLRFYSETIQRKQRMSGFQRACLIEKWMEKKVSEKANADKKYVFSDSEFVRKTHHDHDHDCVFFSSTSISSDSSSGGFSFSSSDTESMYCTKTKAPSCFVRPWPKPVKTRLSAAQTDKPVKAKQRQPPISPGGRLASFVNSLFTTGNTKKSKSSSSTPALSSTVSVVSHDQKQVSSCSSASSFSRSCLSKNTPSTREKQRDGAKRTVRFCPVSVIVDEDSRPYGQREIWKPPSGKYDQEIKFQTMEKARRVEEMAREFLKEYKLNQEKNEFISGDSRRNYVLNHEEEDNVSRCSSSDLFELDHLVLLGNHRYEEELPVYETTHVETNRAIANGWIV